MSLFTKLPVAAALAFAALSTVQAAPLSAEADAIYRPTGRGQGEVDEEATADARARFGEAGFMQRLLQLRSAASTGINYHGGPVMTAGTTNVYYIWYGTWSATQKAILVSMMQNLGGTPIYNINTTYYNSANVRVKNSVTLAGQHDNNYSLGKTLSDAGVATVVSNAINAGWFPKDANGVYFVLTAPDVKESSGFGSKYCGWHTHGGMSGTDIKYSFVGNASIIAPVGCGASGVTPNGDAGVDGMASVMYHELSETVSDPDLNAWYDSTGNENADKCAWKFGTLYTAPNGGKYNVAFGGRKWKLQQNWVNAGTGGCALAY